MPPHNALLAPASLRALGPRAKVRPRPDQIDRVRDIRGMMNAAFWRVRGDVALPPPSSSSSSSSSSFPPSLPPQPPARSLNAAVLRGRRLAIVPRASSVVPKPAVRASAVATPTRIDIHPGSELEGLRTVSDLVFDTKSAVNEFGQLGPQAATVSASIVLHVLTENATGDVGALEGAMVYEPCSGAFIVCTTAFARYTPFLKDFTSRRISPLIPRVQSPPSTPFNFN